MLLLLNLLLLLLLLAVMVVEDLGQPCWCDNIQQQWQQGGCRVCLCYNCTSPAAQVRGPG
jgi:hypothetical protein